VESDAGASVFAVVDDGNRDFAMDDAAAGEDALLKALKGDGEAAMAPKPTPGEAVVDPKTEVENPEPKVAVGNLDAKGVEADFSSTAFVPVLTLVADALLVELLPNNGLTMEDGTLLVGVDSGLSKALNLEFELAAKIPDPESEADSAAKPPAVDAVAACPKTEEPEDPDIDVGIILEGLLLAGVVVLEVPSETPPRGEVTPKAELPVEPKE
jgi:hypothetical protein